jgi:hypothetical protein
MADSPLRKAADKLIHDVCEAKGHPLTFCLCGEKCSPATTMEDFFLNGDPDGTVWMQHANCRETWVVMDVSQAVDYIRAHQCPAKTRRI